MHDAAARRENLRPIQLVHPHGLGTCRVCLLHKLNSARRIAQKREALLDVLLAIVFTAPLELQANVVQLPVSRHAECSHVPCQITLRPNEGLCLKHLEPFPLEVANPDVHGPKSHRPAFTWRVEFPQLCHMSPKSFPQVLGIIAARGHARPKKRPPCKKAIVAQQL